jgi:methanogenic corrinoid protein MtbC1
MDARRASDRRLAAIGERYLAALCAGDASTAEALVAEAVGAGFEPSAIQVRVIAAAMRRIGEMWAHGELTVADEHLASAISQRALLPLHEPLQIAPPRSRERVVLGAVEGQAHVLGLRMVADVLEGAGFHVLYLGADVPTSALSAFVAEHVPAIAGLTSTETQDAPRLAAAILAVHDTHPEQQHELAHLQGEQCDSGQGSCSHDHYAHRTPKPSWNAGRPTTRSRRHELQRPLSVRSHSGGFARVRARGFTFVQRSFLGMNR